MILDKIAERALTFNLDELKIVDMCVGYPYTYVIVEDCSGVKAMGVALTPLEEASDYEVWNPPRVLESSLKEMIQLSTSIHMFERVLGIATINAVSQYFLRGRSENLNFGKNTIEILEEEGVSTVGVVGYMKPLIDSLKKRDFKVIAFERSILWRHGEALSDCLEPRILPKVEALVITGAALLNDTLDIVLNYAMNSRVNILVGPTAQQHPFLLKGLKIDYAQSSLILDVDRAKRLLKITAWRKALFCKETSKTYTLKLEIEEGKQS